MFDKSVSIRMTSCHDPYRELELYLEQAQEEIGKAIKELEWHEEGTLTDQPLDPGDSIGNLLPPPEAFRSTNSHNKTHFRTPCVNSSSLPSTNTVNRVCHAGNVVHIKAPPENRCSSDKHNACRTPFSASLRPGSLGRYRKSTYSPNTKRRLWQMHPSISFPETSRDMLLLGKDSDISSHAKYNGSVTNRCVTDSFDHSSKSLTFDPPNRKSRRHPVSNSSELVSHSDEPGNNLVIPRPPSGDVNLLSIWANNLVLELDKSLPEELFSASSISPSSDYSLSPTKVDDSLESGNGANLRFDALRVSRTEMVDTSQISLPERSLKLMSMSPDSGIEQFSCVTPDAIDDINASVLSSQSDVQNCDLIIPNHNLIPSPPPEFDDYVHKDQDVTYKCNSKSSISNEKTSDSYSTLCTAAPVLEVEELSEVSQNNSQDIQSLARVIAPKTVELEDCPVSRTVCALNNVSSSSQQTADKLSNLKGRHINSIVLDRGYHTISCMPESEKIPGKDSDKWSCTLPRDAEKNVDVVPFQRSVSHSAVFTMDPVSVTELTAFITRMKSSSTQSPTCSDVSTDVKEDNANKDAVTQTTPVPLSPSSSFTWITECDCSDWELPNINSESDENFLTNCSNCKTENQNRKSSSSSSSLGVSSDDDDDDDCVPTTPGSDTSSLYLSACSGSSDSFEETSLTVDETDHAPIQKDQTIDLDSLLTIRRPFRSSESTLRGSTLGDISEEQLTIDSVSVKSTVSNPSFSNSSVGEQCSSFPSTLKTVKKGRNTNHPAQPIEPTILIMNELNLKSVSAPVLLRPKRHTSCSDVPESSSSDSSLPSETKTPNVSNQVPTRSQSAKEINELQAIEACSWLRAAGFPQYAQMYEDNQFPIDISIVQKDHAFLPPDSIQSLFRRLNTLNRCANMKFADHSRKKSVQMEDSDEEEQYALSENWEFQRSSRRWSRISAASDCVALDQPESVKQSNCFSIPGRKYLNPEEVYCSSHDSVFIDEQHSSPDSSVLKPEKTPGSPSHVGDFSPVSSSGSGGTLSLASEDIHERRSLRRTGSDRVKEGAKALLKRMESLKGKRKKKGREAKKVENTVHYSGSSSSSLTSSPQLRRTERVPDNVNLRLNPKPDFVHSKNGAHSDSECRMFLTSDANSNNTKDFKQYKASQTTGRAPESIAKSNTLNKQSHIKTDISPSQLLHPSSAHQEYDTQDKRSSYYDNISAPIVVFNDFCTQSLDRSPARICDERYSSLNNRVQPSENQEDEEIIVINTERRDSGVGSSLTRGIQCIHATWHCFPSHIFSEVKSVPSPMKITDLTASQILLLRKLSLLKLTALMERFSPSSRTGWSWAVPKFIRRIRNPDYKDKVVFGVPLLLTLQRTGQPLPVSIQAAIHYLRNTALDSTGLFRKSGVRSRIQKLKNLNESNPDDICYEEQQSYDVADMLKQYFRELPEALLTNKLSETFIGIFQFIPENLRLEAIQAALMLMPDENREVLHALLEFLSEVSQHSDVNQMSATNLAVCFAPSLFHLSTPRSASSSPRRRKTVGVPDLRELNENRAAYECLSCMVSNYKTLFSVSEEMVAQSRILSATHSQPTTVEKISSFIYNGQMGLKGYTESCIQILLKEAKEKYKGFLNVSQNDHVELSYKKLSDGHPLRLWKVSTEVEAPPTELLNRILRERHLWDPSFTKSKIITRLSNNIEIFQYSISSLPPHQTCDYCVLRSWRTDLPKGACVLIETSVDHPDAEINPDFVRALSLASRYLIEPCGSGKSRITHLSRVDTRGKSSEWYNRAYGHICTLLLIKIRNSFSQLRSVGPETKV